MAIRIVLSSHDSAGLGHLRRNLALAHALARGLDEPVSGLLIAGRPEAAEFEAPEGWDWLILPGIERTATGYGARAIDAGLEELTRLRGRIVLSAVRAFAPDLVIVDRHPFGVERELAPALHALRVERPGCRVVLGLRDVLDAPEVVQREWHAVGGVGALRSVLSAIWVYGDPRIHDLVGSGELPEELRHLVAHTGYLATGRHAGHAIEMQAPYVLTTVGGGVDGVELAAAAAAAPMPQGVAHLVVTGPQMPAEDRRRVREAARPGVRVLRRVPDALPLMRRAEAVVSMGGYNTVCELMTTSTPALVVPRAHRRAEQRLRAEALAAAGAVDALREPPTPEAIGRWVAGAAGRRVAREGIDLDGLGVVPRLAAALLAARPQEVLRVAV
ncbi:glycosyltransferase [Agrococcus sp. SL85]|uniref:glycosyltransferase family protein n=1 Tax=Agrococcus sp. SL85 TaxID=2995141 RepID=UPI00226CF7C3|nr:glycosyltransferase [Agrococcus sp. SL85]WAC65592.1 glycosyltransferase [Agrococcus sp. SL85]